MARVDLEKIRQLRKSMHITQDEMAKRLGYKSSIGYHYLEKGRCQIRAEQLAVIADTLHVPIEDLYVADPSNTVVDRSDVDDRRGGEEHTA